MQEAGQVILKPGKEKSLQRRHPWVFAGAVSHVEGEPENGGTMRIANNAGEFLAWGAYSVHSQIRLRVWSWDERESIDANFLRRRLQNAIALRARLGLEAHCDSLRLVHGESDGLPGLVVDRYGDFLVMQCLSSGAERWKQILADLLLECTGAQSIYERSDVDVRQLEGLPAATGMLRGVQPPEMLEIYEYGLKYLVDVKTGHKTGFYLDQRRNRWRARQLCQGLEVLDCFSYSGGFAVACLAGEAERVTLVDSSGPALELARRNLEINQQPAEKAEFIEGDVFRVLRTMRDSRRSFDLVILDPPKFAPTAAQAERAARGYKDINLLGLKLVRPGGLLITFSCSGGVDAALFQKIVAGAALDAGIQARIVEHLQQSADHPVALNFPEGAYLKGLIIQVG
jgi:23S rRNA (cytosine1962-C5)-methyltransferase